MTRDTTRQADGGLGHGHGGSDNIDLLSGLWEEAPFARLPWDAPNELKDLVEHVDNPKRVYAIHKASRRHNFQLLVQKYTVQLREGCGSDSCSTPTCFTCRRRIVGRAPIRRYSPSSARTLAVYLASQDNAENGLCPGLRPVKTPPTSLNSLMFTPTPKAQQIRDDHAIRVHKGHSGFLGEASLPGLGESTASSKRSHGSSVVSKGGPSNELQQGSEPVEESSQRESKPLEFYVSEEPTSKDYRSFAANVFGTVAFKMLEWLTPTGVEEMIRRTRNLQVENSGTGPAAAPAKPKTKAENGPPSRVPHLVEDQPTATSGSNGAGTATLALDSSGEASPDAKELRERTPKDVPAPRAPPPTNARPTSSARNSNAKVRRSSGPRPKRQLSIDPTSQDALGDDPYSGLLKSPRPNGSQADKGTRGLKTAATSLPRPISQLSSAGFFDEVLLEKMPPPKPAESKTKTGRGQLDGPKSSGSSSPKEQPPSSTNSATPSDPSYSADSHAAEQESDSEDDSMLPQTLTRLNAEVVDFICDVLQDDGTNEDHLLEPAVITKFHGRFATHAKGLRRKSHHRSPYPRTLKQEWKLFVEQSIFYILSDPKLTIKSFTKRGQLYDSQTLWYCMLRMTRVTPSLVFHSLWMAAAQLFAPPKFLHSLRSPTARLFPRHEKSLSNLEAGCLVSICLHVLVAAAPLLTDTAELYDMSRIMSHGLTLAGSGAVAQQPAELCLKYDDAFTNDLALRLARRVFAAIKTRRYYDEMNDSKLEGDEHEEPDVLAPLFSQLDFLNLDAVYILNFSFTDCAFHETRVPTLLLDWARAVMLKDWDGNPEVPGDGPFGGALALIEAMHQRRQPLLLGDGQFRCEYFADRLDAVEMPVAWLAHTRTRQKLHLLDFPYLFSPANLVSYFRSINFSRMSRAFEESSSLQSRMSAIVSPGSLIINPHHKNVLQDFLKTASSKYLILEISRENVIRDAFDQLWRRQERELLRPLKVHLGEGGGEEGFDSGGVQQEFFRLAIAEALDPDYGAFTVDDRTRMTWFQPGSVVPEWKFELIGLLMSLAVYNGLTLPITFPKALYRKLLGEPVTDLHHIADGWPDLANGLTSLLDWDEKDGLIEDVFARTYEFSVSVLGQPITRPMRQAPSSPGSASSTPLMTSATVAEEEWPQFPQMAWEAASRPAPHTENPNPDDSPLVTGANRNAYVSDYIRYLTDVSVRPQYAAFERGFRSCLHHKSLSLLTSNLLQSVAEGVQEIDISELRRYARYVGWDASHRGVRDFWSIVKRYDDSMKRKLLEFVTASDRVPVGGMKNLQFVVQRNGTEDEPGGHLPTAYTCYGTLLLPEYRDKEVLRERLAMALENAQGFGFA